MEFSALTFKTIATCSLSSRLNEATKASTYTRANSEDDDWKRENKRENGTRVYNRSRAWITTGTQYASFIAWRVLMSLFSSARHSPGDSTFSFFFSLPFYFFSFFLRRSLRAQEFINVHGRIYARSFLRWRRYAVPPPSPRSRETYGR